VISAAEMAEAMIKAAARIEIMMSFLFFWDEFDVVEFVRGAVERRDEPPGSDGPSLSKSIVIVVSVFVWELVMKYEEVVIV
jgi:hypothetical protein